MATKLAKRIADLLTRPGNDSCSECDRPNNEPHWASFFTCPVDNRRLGVLCCPKCAHLHQTVGEGEFTLKGLNDTEGFTERDVEDIEVSGNIFVNKVYEFGVTNEKEGRDQREFGYEAFFFEKMMNLTYFNDELYTHLIISSLRAQVLERVKLAASEAEEEEKKEDDNKKSSSIKGSTSSDEKPVDRRPSRDDKSSSKNRDLEKLEMAAALPLFQLTAGRRSARASGTNDDLRSSNHQSKSPHRERHSSSSSKDRDGTNDDLRSSNHHSKSPRRERPSYSSKDRDGTNDDLRSSNHHSKSPRRERPSSSSKDRDDRSNQQTSSEKADEKGATEKSGKDSPKREDRDGLRHSSHKDLLDVFKGSNTNRDDSSNADELTFACDFAGTEDDENKEPSKETLPQSMKETGDSKEDIKGSTSSSDDWDSKGDLDLHDSQHTTSSSKSRGSKGNSDRRSTSKSDSRGSRGDSDLRSSRHKHKRSDSRGSKGDSDLRGSTHSNEDMGSKGDLDLRSSQHSSSGGSGRKGRFDLSCDARKERMREQRKNALRASSGGKRDASPKRSSLAVFRFPRETSKDKLSKQGMRRTKSSGSAFSSSRSSKQDLLGHSSSDRHNEDKKNAGWNSTSSKSRHRESMPSPVRSRRRTISMDPDGAPLVQTSSSYNPELLRHQKRIEGLIKSAPIVRPEMIDALISTAPVHLHAELKAALKKPTPDPPKPAATADDKSPSSDNPEDSKLSKDLAFDPRKSLTIADLAGRVGSGGSFGISSSGASFALDTSFDATQSRPSIVRTTSNQDLNPRALEIGVNRRASLARTGSAHEVMSSADDGDQDNSSTNLPKKTSAWDVLRNRRGDLIRLAKEQEMAERKGNDNRLAPDNSGDHNEVKPNLLGSRRHMLGRRSTSRRNIMEQQLKSAVDEAVEKEAADNHDVKEEDGSEVNATESSSLPTDASTTQDDPTEPKLDRSGWDLLKSRRADFVKLAMDKATNNDAPGNQAATDVPTTTGENKPNILGSRRHLLGRRSTSRRNIIGQQLKSAVEEAAEKEATDDQDVSEENGSEVNATDSSSLQTDASTTQDDSSEPKLDRTGWDLLKSRRADFVKLARDDTPGNEAVTDGPTTTGENKPNLLGSRRHLLGRPITSRRNIMGQQDATDNQDASEENGGGEVDDEVNSGPHRIIRRGAGRRAPARSKSADLGRLRKEGADFKRCTTVGGGPSATDSSNLESDASTTQEDPAQKKNASGWDLLKSRRADFVKLAKGEATNNDANGNPAPPDMNTTTGENKGNLLRAGRGLLAGRGTSRKNIMEQLKSAVEEAADKAAEKETADNQGASEEDGGEVNLFGSRRKLVGRGPSLLGQQNTATAAAQRRGLRRGNSSSPMRPGISSRSPPPGPSQTDDSEPTTSGARPDPRRALRRGISMGGRGRSSSNKNLMADDSEAQDSETPQQATAQSLGARGLSRRGLMQGGSSFKMRRGRSIGNVSANRDEDPAPATPTQLQRAQSGPLNYDTRPSYRDTPKEEEVKVPDSSENESKHDDGKAGAEPEQEAASDSPAFATIAEDAPAETPAAAPAKRGADYYKQKLNATDDKRHSILSVKKKQERRNVPALCA